MSTLNRIEAALAKQIIRRRGWTQAIELINAFRSPEDKILDALDDMRDRGLIDRFNNNERTAHYYVWAQTDEAASARHGLKI